MADYSRLEGASRRVRTNDAPTGRRRDAQPSLQRQGFAELAAAHRDFVPRMATPEQLSALKTDEGKIELPQNYRRGRYLDLLA